MPRKRMKSKTLRQKNEPTEKGVFVPTPTNSSACFRGIVLSAIFTVWITVVGIGYFFVFSIGYILSTVLAVVFSLTLGHWAWRRPLYWDWTVLDTSTKALVESGVFDSGFLWGTSTASHQIEGGPHQKSNWYHWEKCTRNGGKTPCVKENQKCGDAADHWNRLEADTKLMTKLGVNSYRFSLSWAKIQPTEHSFDHAVLAHYHDELKALAKVNIVPMLTLHHFDHPLWFEEKGGFEEVENIQLFLDFSLRVFEEYGSKVNLWCTFNEPAVFVTNGWVTGIFPPGKTNPQQAGIVLRNIMMAHVSVYKLLKARSLEMGVRCEIGMVKDIFQFEASTWWNPFDRFVAGLAENAFNRSVLNFLKTGHYSYWVPFVASVYYVDKSAPETSDFLGLNYYSHYYVSVWNAIFEPDENRKLFPPLDGAVMTDMPYPIYAEGFYRALKQLSEVNKRTPIYVCENGIADSSDDKRALWISRYIFAMSRAMKEGVNVRGYYYWSLMDNFEWSEGFNMRFGLYHVDFNTQKRTLRNGSNRFVEIVDALKQQ